MAISRRRTCDLKTCEGLIEAYCKIPGGEYHTLQEGVLGLGLCVCRAPGRKVAVIREIPLNEWTSTHTVRFYEKMPEKYRREIEKCG